MTTWDGLNELVADLTSAPLRTQRDAWRVVDRSARAGRDQAQELAPSGPHLPQYASSITSETYVEGGDWVGEFGPEKGGQGSLGHILEDGSAKSPPMAHVGPALDLVSADFLDQLGQAGTPW